MNYHLSTRHYVQGEILPQHYWLHFHTFKNCWIPSKMGGISIIPGWFCSVKLRLKVTVDAPLSKEVHLRLARLAVPSPYVFAVWIRPMDTGIPTPLKQPHKLQPN